MYVVDKNNHARTITMPEKLFRKKLASKEIYSIDGGKKYATYQHIGFAIHYFPNKMVVLSPI